MNLFRFSLLLFIAGSVAIVSPDVNDCLLSRSEKKKPVRDFQYKCLHASKDSLRQDSRVIQYVAMTQEEKIIIVDHEFEGWSKQELERYYRSLEEVTQATEKFEAAVKKFEKDVHLITKNKKY